MGIKEQVELAIKNYKDLPQAVLGEDLPENERYLATPNRLAYALGWVVANAIVNARFADSGIDAIPVYHPEHGWDRFLLTRRVSSPFWASEPADSFGLIMLSGEGAPRITRPSGAERLALGEKLQSDPEQAIAELLELFPVYGLPDPQQLGPVWPGRRDNYPRIVSAVTEMVLENPGLVVLREIFVDDQAIDGVYHPLYLHAVAERPTTVYTYFLLETESRAVFFRVDGVKAIYETERGGWSTVKKQLYEEGSVEDVKRRIRGWLHIGRQPDPENED